MIVDALTHVHPDPKGFGERYDASVEALLHNLDTCEVDRAVVMAIASDTRYGVTSDYVAACCRQHADRLIGFASVHPLTDKDPVGKFEHCIQDLGLRGLKLHPRTQQLSVEDPRVTPLVEKAAELKVPVAICALIWKHAPIRYQLPLNIDTLCKRVPEAKIIVCHAGGFRFLDALTLAVANDNVYLETSVSLTYFHGTPFEDQFMFVLKQVGARRVIYGSDHPDHTVKECYARSRGIFEQHGYSENDLRMIFGGNMLALLGESA